MNETILHLRETMDSLLQTAQFNILADTAKAGLLDARQRGDKAAEALALIGLAETHKFTGKFKDALLLCEGASNLARQANEPHLVIQATLTRASIHLVGTYHIYEAETDYRLALNLAHDINTSDETALALIGISAALNAQGDIGRAERFAREAFEIAREIDNSYLIANSLTVLSSVLGHANQIEKALKASQDAIMIAQAENYRLLEMILTGNIGQLLVKQGRYTQEGLQLLEKALRMAKEIHSVPDQFVILCRMGRSLEMQSKIEEAAEHYNAMLIRAQEWQTRAYEGLGFFNLGTLALNRQHYDDAIANLDQALIIARETKNPYHEAKIEEVLGVTYSKLQEWNSTLDHYMAARTLYDALDNEYMVNQMMQAILLTYFRRIMATILHWLGIGKKEATDTPPPEA
jgi:tetratricopeptide (TPR) repeat protein